MDGMTYATLIPVKAGEVGGSPCQVVNAKDLHICLKVKDRFDQWIRRRAAEYGFRDGEHFCTKLCKSTGGRPRTEYTLSLSMAMNLAVVEKTEVGQQIRDYFFACEKALRQIAPEVAADCLRKALNPHQQFQLKEKVDSKVACLAKARQRAGYHEIWSNLKSRHQVAQYRDIPQGEFEDACKYVESYVWDGEWLGRQEGEGLRLTEAQAINLSLLLHSVAWVGYRWQQGIGAGVRHLNRHLWSGTFEHVDSMVRSARFLDSDLLPELKKAEERRRPGGLGGLRPAECIARGIAA